MPVDYQNGKIYKIVDLSENMIYVGSTVKTLAQRMGGHKDTYKIKSNYGHYSCQEIFDTYGIDNCRILLLENFPCNSRKELVEREGKYIRELDCVNKRIAGRTKLQYNQDNRVEFARKKKEEYANDGGITKQYKKDYYQKHKEEKKPYMLAYYQKNKEEMKRKRDLKKLAAPLEVQNSQLILPTYTNDNLTTVQC
jgi:hypothetical protein